MSGDVNEFDMHRYITGWDDPRVAWDALVERWGHERLEQTIIFMVKNAKDHRGLHIVLTPTPLEVDKVMSAIYAPDMVTVADFEVVGLSAPSPFDWTQDLDVPALEALPMERVGGDVVCDICGIPYWGHADETRLVSAIDDRPFLKRLCDGTLGKL